MVKKFLNVQYVRLFCSKLLSLIIFWICGSRRLILFTRVFPALLFTDLIFFYITYLSGLISHILRTLLLFMTQACLLSQHRNFDSVKMILLRVFDVWAPFTALLYFRKISIIHKSILTILWWFSTSRLSESFVLHNEGQFCQVIKRVTKFFKPLCFLNPFRIFVLYIYIYSICICIYAIFH